MKTTKVVLLVGFLLASLTGCASLNPNTEGQLVKELEAKNGAFKACYEAALEKDREVKGDMGLKLNVNKESGKVTKAKVKKGSIKDDAMKSCVCSAAEEIKLPEPPGVPVEGNYALEFSFE